MLDRHQRAVERVHSRDAEGDRLNGPLTRFPFHVISDVELRIQHQDQPADDRPDDGLASHAECQCSGRNDRGGIGHDFTVARRPETDQDGQHDDAEPDVSRYRLLYRWVVSVPQSDRQGNRWLENEPPDNSDDQYTRQKPAEADEERPAIDEFVGSDIGNPGRQVNEMAPNERLPTVASRSSPISPSRDLSAETLGIESRYR